MNNAPDDNGFDDVNGCTVLFMWYLFAQLGFTEKEIVAAAGATLADVYRTQYVAGSFQVKIRVSTAPEMLPAERDSLAIFKWRLGHTPSTDRWYPVLQRYVDLLAERVRGLGGDPDQIPPSLDGAPPLTGKGSEEGYVLEVHYDCQGHVTAFVLGTCCGSVTFTLSEAGLGELLLTAMRLRLRVEVVTCQDSDQQIEKVILRP